MFRGYALMAVRMSGAEEDHTDALVSYSGSCIQTHKDPTIILTHSFPVYGHNSMKYDVVNAYQEGLYSWIN